MSSPGPATAPALQPAGPSPSAQRPTMLTDLLPELLRRVASYLHANEIATSFQLVCKRTLQHLGDFKAISLSAPVPAHALVWRFSQPGVVRELTLQQRLRVAARAVETGCLAAVRLLVTGDGGPEGVGATGCAPLPGTLVPAARAGQLAVCQHLRQQGCPWSEVAFHLAASKGHTDVCLWLLAEGCPGADALIEYIADGSYQEACEQLLAAGCPWSECAAGAAASGGHYSGVRWLLQLSDEQRPTCFSYLLSGAAFGLSLPQLQELHAQYMPRVPEDQHSEAGSRMLFSAAAALTTDFREKIDWLLSCGYRPAPEEWSWGMGELAAVDSTASSGSELVSRLAFLKQHGFKLGKETAEYLMTGKQDEPAALAFMLDEAGLQPGDGMAQAVAEAACGHGRLESLQLLWERGWLAAAYVDMAALFKACGGVGQDVAAWLVATLCGSGPGQHALTAELFAHAAAAGSIPLLQQLRARGCTWSGGAWAAAAWAGCEALLEWLHAEGCPMPVSALRTLSP
jgi:hypothetical protein